MLCNTPSLRGHSLVAKASDWTKGRGQSNQTNKNLGIYIPLVIKNVSTYAWPK